MKTTSLEDYVVPNRWYQVEWKGLTALKGSCKGAAGQVTAVVPPLCEVQGVWDRKADLQGVEDNVLGHNGVLRLSVEQLQVPAGVPLAGHFAYYGAQLLKVGTTFHLAGREALPLFEMEVGAGYAKGYLLRKELGGGCYLEYHDAPHFHMPLAREARGYLLLGKRVVGRGYWHLSALPIPYGYAVYMPPGVVHCDGFLVGQYRVGYTITSHYSTVFLRTLKGGMVDVKVIKRRL